MRRSVLVPALLALSLFATACAGPGGGLGLPSCAPDAGPIQNPPAVHVGDVWVYRENDDYTGIDRGVFRLEVTGVTASEIQARITLPSGRDFAESYDPQWGWIAVSNRNWDWLSRLAPGSGTIAFSPAFDATPFPLRAGQTWSNHVVAIDPVSQARVPIDIDGKARCWEKISVPAGEFVALRIERTAYLQDLEWYRSQTTLRQVEWYVPEANRSVMIWRDSYYYDYRQRGPSMLILGDRLRWEWVR
ncbi:MAG: hypothetical protein U1E63_01140 [Burkholderiales bacterium]